MARKIGEKEGEGEGEGEQFGPNISTFSRITRSCQDRSERNFQGMFYYYRGICKTIIEIIG